MTRKSWRSTTRCPEKIWEEVVHDFQLGAILDIAAGDGSLALTAVRHRLPYTGIVFTTHHRDLMKARLLEILSAGALTAGDKWYEPSLVKTLVAAAKKKNKKLARSQPRINPNRTTTRTSLTSTGRSWTRKGILNTNPKPKPRQRGRQKQSKEGEREQPRCVFGAGQCGKQRGVGLMGAPRSRRTALVAGFDKRDQGNGPARQAQPATGQENHSPV